MWEGIKRDRAVNAESSGRPLVVSCELTDEVKRAADGGGFVHSLCKWDFDADPAPDFSTLFDN